MNNMRLFLQMILSEVILLHLMITFLLILFLVQLYKMYGNKIEKKKTNEIVIEAYLKLIENTKIPIVLLQFKSDDKAYYVKANDAYVELTGRANKLLNGKAIDDVFEPSVVEFYYSKLRKLRNTGESFKFQSTLYTAYGELYANYFVTSIYINGKYDFFTVSYEDISEFKKEHEELKVISNRFSTVMELSRNIAFFQVDLGNKQIWASNYFFELLEIDRNKDNLFNFDEMYQVFIAFNAIINNNKALNIDALFEPGVKQVKCQLPVSKKIIYLEVETIQKDQVGMYASLVDITEKVNETLLLKNRLKFDSLTGLINRDYLNYEINRIIELNPQNYGALFFIDIENFKNINDRYGHHFGDEVIKSFANVLRERIKTTPYKVDAILARKAGDEFIIYAHSKNDTQLLMSDASTFIGDTTIDIHVKGINLPISFNVGISIYNKDTNDIDQLIQYADFASHQSKRDILNNINFHNKKNYDYESNKLAIINDLSSIIENKEWTHVYQPILDFHTASFMGYEALTRPFRSNIKELLEIAYEVGAFKKLEQALYFSVLYDFSKRGVVDKYVSINEGPFDIFDGDQTLLDLSTKIIEEANMKMIVEITEYARMDIVEVQQKIERLKRYNSKIAIDDFGSGYSNELALLSLNPTYIKIDRGLISNIDKDERKQLLVSNLVRYANKNITVIAEGVETKEELEKVIELGIDCAQGYYIAKPNKDLIDISDELRDEINEIKKRINR